jgi:hypothetical protein
VRYDRDELLARTDLAALADELLGFHVGNGRNARWPSPVPNHPQTGRTPPMSIFVDHRGIERWTCFATGANGTAIDLVMVATGRNISDSIEWLGERARLDVAAVERVPVVRRRTPEAPPRAPSAALKEYVETCERLLWEPAGSAIRHWLVDKRCLDPDVLRQNRVGADPGPRTLRRARGLPFRGPAAVFPALDAEREAVYLQARYLQPPPGRGKYDNPTAAHGVNPRIAALEPASGSAAQVTLVTEGIPDALTVASAGYRAAAVLGVGVPDRRVAAALAEQPGALAVVFDADAAGHAGMLRLVSLLREQGRTDVIAFDPPEADLNTWLVIRGRDGFHDQLDLSIRLAVTGLDRSRTARSIA